MTWAAFLKHLEKVKDSVQVPDPVYKNYSLFLFGPKNPLRKIAIKIAHHPNFDRFILFLIVLNCGFMMATAPYAPCCRPGETVAEGGNTISSFAEMAPGFSCNVETATTGAKTFIPVNDDGTLNVTACGTLADGTPNIQKGSESQTICPSTGYIQFRGVAERKAAFPAHLQGTFPDANWPWVQTMEKCCVPTEWAEKNGMYQSSLPDFKALYPNATEEELAKRSDVSVLQPKLCAEYGVIDAAQIADYIFTAFFTFECLVKILAMGFILDKGDPHRHMPSAYLRDLWNWLDFVVVIAAWVGMFTVGGGLTVLRTFRVLRPLRAMNKWPAMKMLVSSLMRSLPPMKYVAYLMAFLLLVFGIMGTQLWNGLLHGQCQYWDPENADDGPWVPAPGQDGLVCGLQYLRVTDPSYAEAVANGATVSMSGDDYTRISELFYMPLDKDGKIEVSGTKLDWSNQYSNDTTVARVGQYYLTGRTCDDRVYGDKVWSREIKANVTLLNGEKVEIPTMACRFGDNPNYNLSSFDNLLQAILWIFASITLEGWVDSMYAVNQAWLFNQPIGTFFVEGVYFTLLYLIGSMFMLNLTLAVIWEEFENERERQEEDEAGLIFDELKILERKGITVEDQETAELNIRKERRAAALRAELTGDPVPDPWTKTPCIVKGWYALSINMWFGHFITLHIVVNTVTMALESHDWKLFRETFNWDKPDVYDQLQVNGEALSEPQALTTALGVLNYYFAAIFLCEAIIKLIGLSPREYFRDGFNCFDFTIVIFSIIEFIFAMLDVKGVAGLSVLRSFRLLRVFKLAKAWKTLQELIATILAALSDVIVAGCLLLLIMFIFSLLGMEAFGGNWNAETFGDPDEVPRANFDNFYNAFMTVFQVLTGENWNDLLWASYKTTGFLGWFYFIALTFLGNYMIFNLFLAILLAKFEEGGDQASLDEEDLKKEEEASLKANGGAAANAAPAVASAGGGSPRSAKVMPLEAVEGKVTDQGDAAAAANSDIKDSDGDEEDIPSAEKEEEMECIGTSLFLLKPDNGFRRMCFKLASNKTFDQFILLLILVSSLFLAMDEPWVSACACYNPDVDSAASSGDSNGLDSEGNAKVVGVPGPSWSIACTSDVPQAWAMTTGAMNGNSMGYYNFLIYSDLIITIIFTFEMVVKIFALGFALHKGSYLRNSWNVLDFIIVVISLVAIATGPLVTGMCLIDAGGGSALKSLRSLRALRALRPLRVIKRAPGLRLVVNSLFMALPAITQVGMVTLLFMMILAILGQQFFMGQVAACNDGDAAMFTDCYGNFTISDTDCGMLPNARYPTLFSAEEWATFADPVKTPRFQLDSQEACMANGDAGSQFPRTWQSFAVNFDTFGNALTTVFEVASGEMWPDIMATTIDARGIGVQQLPNSYPFAFVWYFLVQFMIAFVMLNVFIGVIIEKYNENKDASEGSGLLTNEQKIWVETMKLAMNSKAKRKLSPPVALKPYRMWAFSLVIKPMFDYVIMSCIMLNVFLMACSHFDQSVQWHTALTICNMTFNIIFTIEMFTKWWGIGTQYFGDNWNNFDCALVLLAWIAQTGALPPTIASLFRIFRVMRLVRLVRNVTGLLNLFKTLMFSIPALLNVGIIMGLVMFICANLAMNSFGNNKEGELLTGDANFQTFWLSFNTMWRMSSGESYNGIMHDANIKMPYCSPHRGGRIDPYQGNCGSETMSFLIFQLCFTILNYVLVNLFIAIILDNFSDTCAMSESTVTAETLQDFDDVWAKFDPRGTQKISELRLGQMLEQVEYPLGLKDVPVEHLHGKSLRKYRNTMIQSLDIPSVDGFINFTQTKNALTMYAMGDVPLDAIAEDSLMVKRFKRQQAAVEERLNRDIGAGTLDIQRSQSFRTLADGSKKPYGVNHVQAAKLIQAALRGFWSRKNLEKLQSVFRKHLELAKHASTKQAMGAPGEGPTGTMAVVSAASDEPVPEPNPVPAGEADAKA
jgi:hypothetical protein